MPEEDVFDLEVAIKTLASKFSEIDCIYLFGSRRFQTGSSRSDIDILLATTGRIKPSALRDFTIEFNSALDLFLLENGKAISVANDSFIEAKDNNSLISTVNAILLYDKRNGISQDLINRKKQEIDKRVKHELTSLPNGSAEAYEIKALKKYFKAARENGLTVRPYIGTSTDEASEFIVEVIRNLVDVSKSVTNHGQAKNGWTKSLQSEYDFQNLFWITVKPWLPNLSREQVAIKYDGQEKRSDFSIFNDQLVLELKHIRDDGDKRETVKTLEGLRNFYIQHPNIRVLIFAILVDMVVMLDGKKWEFDFSYCDNIPVVKTVIIRNG